MHDFRGFPFVCQLTGISFIDILYFQPLLFSHFIHNPFRFKKYIDNYWHYAYN